MRMNVLSVTVKSLHRIDIFGIVCFEVDSDELQKDLSHEQLENNLTSQYKIQCQWKQGSVYIK